MHKSYHSLKSPKQHTTKPLVQIIQLYKQLSDALQVILKFQWFAVAFSIILHLVICHVKDLVKLVRNIIAFTALIDSSAFLHCFEVETGNN